MFPNRDLGDRERINHCQPLGTHAKVGVLKHFTNADPIISEVVEELVTGPESLSKQSEHSLTFRRILQESCDEARKLAVSRGEQPPPVLEHMNCPAHRMQFQTKPKRTILLELGGYFIALNRLQDTWAMRKLRQFEFTRLAIFAAHTDMCEMFFKFLHTVESSTTRDVSSFMCLLREFSQKWTELFVKGKIWAEGNQGTWTYWALQQIKRHRMFRMAGGRVHVVGWPGDVAAHLEDINKHTVGMAEGVMIGLNCEFPDVELLSQTECLRVSCWWALDQFGPCDAERRARQARSFELETKFRKLALARKQDPEKAWSQFQDVLPTVIRSFVSSGNNLEAWRSTLRRYSSTQRRAQAHPVGAVMLGFVTSMPLRAEGVGPSFSSSFMPSPAHVQWFIYKESTVLEERKVEILVSCV